MYIFVHRYTQTMTNIINQKPIKKMQSHIDKAYEFLDQFLPYEYVVEVELILQKKKIKVSGGTIRNIRTKRVPNPRIDVLNALLLVAKKNQKQLLELESNLKK